MMIIYKINALHGLTVYLLLFLALGTTSATGASLFSVDTSVKFSITNISNTTDPGGGAISGLDISGSFALDPESQFEKSSKATADHEFNPINLPTSPAIGDSFSQKLHVSGNAIDGYISSYHFSMGTLQLTNSSSNDYVMAFNMDYELTASASGSPSNDSDAGVLLELEYAFPGGVEDVVSLVADFAEPSASAKNGVNFTVALPSGAANKAYYADLAVNGLAVSAVPVPAAIWLLGSGLLCLTGLVRAERQS